ncbi:MAG TPA: hypothetical protein VK810_05115 [Dongiaceae bacterium]|nr:hypothetical protein [Dongiaceae bacterium]
MKVCSRRFNLFLLLTAALVLSGGCKTEKQHEQDKLNKVVGALRVHIEVVPDEMGTSQTISVLRSEPVLVTIAKEPVLTEANIILAKVIPSPGGFSVAVQFDEAGGLMLEQFSAANPGKHFVIYGQWSDKPADGRWLAAPLITHHITNGVLSFTADASAKEMDQLVLGLNNVAKKVHTGRFK